MRPAPSTPESIGAIVSYDNGDTWHDAAVSKSIPNAIYCIGGCRNVGPLGIVGSFTSQYGTRGDPHFFRIFVPERTVLLAPALAALVVARRKARRRRSETTSLQKKKHQRKKEKLFGTAAEPSQPESPNRT